MLEYHSAHLPPIENTISTNRWIGRDGSVAFVWDMLYGELPPEYNHCDVFYADLPWRTGFQTFNQRAGITDNRTYRQFMATVSKIVANVNRPTVLVSGKHALDYLPVPTQTEAVQMPGTRQDALAIFYNLVTGPNWHEIHGLLQQLARTYQRVGDFCCGYGSAPRAFAQHGKPFVASDFNPACIGYIAGNANNWTPADA